MLHTISVQNKNTEVNIVPAVNADINALLELNQKWQLSNLNNNRDKGFLGGCFDFDTFKHIIEQEEIMIAKLNNSVVAYMLSVQHLHSGVLIEHAKMAEEVVVNGIVPANSKIAIGIQTAVEEVFHGTGLIILLRNAFKALMSKKYQYFLTTISLENIRSFKSATNFGWQIVGQNQHHYYLILKV